jgi:acetylornithine deacetylase/succinyl-diaminopimelate desuccinylase-like protein
MVKRLMQPEDQRMDRERIRRFVEQSWEESAVAALFAYIRIPNKSPAFDPSWQASGHMESAVALIEQWCREHSLPDMALEVVRLEGRTPLLLMEVPGDGQDCVLLYGHLDKQPEMTGWREDLGPWRPVREGDRLYGRGAGDDGYAVFAALNALRALAEQSIPHRRCVILIECCEESGSYDLPHYIDLLAHRIADPSLVICLDSGCGNYEQLWCTTSLRGMASGALTIDVLREGVHSGDASGIVPSPFRVLRQLLNRLEDAEYGTILPRELQVTIPEERVAQAHRAAAVLADGVFQKYPFLPGVRPVGTDGGELVLNRTWRPALSVTGAAGLPALADAGNVTVPRIAVKLSLRLAPPCDAEGATRQLKQLLEDNPPYGVHISFEPDSPASGWHAPPLARWLATAADEASLAYFGKEAMYMGEGGTIPFMAMLGKRFPASQFLVTGVLGPEANAHGPNEFLHIPTAKNITCCVAEILASQYHATGA